MFPHNVLQFLDRTTESFPLKLDAMEFERFKTGSVAIFEALFTAYHRGLYQHILNLSGSAPVTFRIIVETYANAWDYRAKLLNERLFVFYIYYTARSKLQSISRILLN